MAKRSRRRKKNNWGYEIGNGLGGLASVGVMFFVVPKMIDAIGISGVLVGAIVALATWMIITVAFISLEKRFQTKQNAQFDFDTTISKHQQASEFEQEIATLIHQLTGKQTEVIGGAGDGGIDIKVLDETARLVGIVQCKKLASNKFVYPAYIRELNTVRHYHQVNIAYLVSTGRFSDDSRDLAKQLGIKLIDGQDLRELRIKATRRNTP